MFLDTIQTIIPIIRDTVFAESKNESLEFINKTGATITAILTIIISGIISYITLRNNNRNTIKQIEANSISLSEQIENSNKNLLLQIKSERENFLNEKRLENKQKIFDEFVKLRDEIVELMTNALVTHKDTSHLINSMLRKNGIQVQYLVRLKINTSTRQIFTDIISKYAVEFVEYVKTDTSPERETQLFSSLTQLCSDYTTKSLVLIEQLTEKLYKE